MNNPSEVTGSAGERDRVAKAVGALRSEVDAAGICRYCGDDDTHCASQSWLCCENCTHSSMRLAPGRESEPNPWEALEAAVSAVVDPDDAVSALQAVPDGWAKLGGKWVPVEDELAPRRVYVGYACDEYKATYRADSGRRVVVLRAAPSVRSES